MELNWLEFWYQALASPLGKEFAVSDPEKAKQRLYQARARAQDPQLSSLTIRTDPLNPSGSLWIVKASNGSKKP